MIPKIIWQTHEWEYEDLPIYFAKTSMTWINLNPEYRYVYMTGAEREEFVKLKHPEIYPYYKYMGCVDKRYESDIWRYLVLNKYGGFYSDLDSICVKPLNYVLKNFENNHEIITLSPAWNSNKDDFAVHYPNITFMDYKDITNNSNFGSISKSIFLKNIIKNMQTETEKLVYLKHTKQLYINKKITEPMPNPWDLFNLGLSKNLNVRFIDDYAIHSSDFKKDFINDTTVDWYGEKIPYLELLKKENIKEYYPNCSLKEVKRLTLNRKKEYARIFN